MADHEGVEDHGEDQRAPGLEQHLVGLADDHLLEVAGAVLAEDKRRRAVKLDGTGHGERIGPARVRIQKGWSSAGQSST